MLGLRQGKVTRFVKQYANLAQTISEAATAYVSEVTEGTFPTQAHTFADIPASTAPVQGAPGAPS